MVAITGQVPTTAIGTDAFQECDTVGITRSVTKHNELVMTRRGPPAGHPPGVPHRHDRPARAGAGRRAEGRAAEHDGVVLADRREVVDLPGYQPTTKGHPAHDQGGGRADPGRERPVLYVGGGILKARAAEALRELAELTDIHVVTTLMARGAFPDAHPLCLGMPGMHGNATAVTALQKADLLIALGARFDDRVTGKVSTLRPRGQDHPRRHRPGRAGQGPPARRAHRRRLPPRDRGARQGDPRTCWPSGADAGRHRRLAAAASRGWREQFPLTYEPSRAGRGAEAAVLPRAAARHARPRARSSCRGVGQHQMWSSQYWRFERALHVGELGRPRHDGLLACRPPSAPRSAGPTARCGPIDGDGCFQMTAQELVTAVDRAHPDQGRPSSTTPTSAWSASGRRCSTTSATARCTCRPTCPTT